MKKYMKCGVIVCIICAFSLSGCSTGKELPQNFSGYENQTETQTAIANNSFDIYTMNKGFDNEFDKTIAENQIDKDYNVEFDEATTTQEFVDIQIKYIDMWKSEIQNDIKKLELRLTENDFVEFNNSQEQWEKQLLESVNSDRNIIENSQYGIMIGSSFKWLWLSNIREKYSERSIHVKYLLYLLETNAN